MPNKKKVIEERQEIIEKLKKWKEDKEKQKLKKQKDAKPMFKFYHVSHSFDGAINSKENPKLRTNSLKSIPTNFNKPPDTIKKFSANKRALSETTNKNSKSVDNQKSTQEKTQNSEEKENVKLNVAVTTDNKSRIMTRGLKRTSSGSFSKSEQSAKKICQTEFNVSENELKMPKIKPRLTKNFTYNVSQNIKNKPLDSNLQPNLKMRDNPFSIFKDKIEMNKKYSSKTKTTSTKLDTIEKARLDKPLSDINLNVNQKTKVHDVKEKKIKKDDNKLEDQKPSEIINDKVKLRRKALKKQSQVPCTDVPVDNDCISSVNEKCNKENIEGLVPQNVFENVDNFNDSLNGSYLFRNARNNSTNSDSMYFTACDMTLSPEESRN